MPPTKSLGCLLLASLAWLTSRPAPAQQAVLTDPLDARIAECSRTLEGDCFLALADVEVAADTSTRFAREHRDDPRAPTVLARAVELWRETGDASRALEAAREFRRTYPNHPRLPRVADQVFLLGQLQLPGCWRAWCAHREQAGAVQML